LDEALIEEKLRVTNKATMKVTMFMSTSILRANHLRAQLKYRRWLEFSSLSILNLKLKELNKTRGQVGLHKIKATREIKGIFSQGEVPSYTVT
jgi:hypothetical protein